MRLKCYNNPIIAIVNTGLKSGERTKAMYVYLFLQVERTNFVGVGEVGGEGVGGWW